MTNAPKDFDLAQELADTADWDETTDDARRARRRPRRRQTRPAETRPRGDGRRAGPRRALRAAPGGRALHRARGHHRGRVPPAPARAGHPRRRVDRGLGAGRRELHGRARAARRDGRLGGARRALPAPRQPRPRDLHRPRQGRGPRRDRARHRRRHRDPRRRARAQPAAQPRGQGQGQGRRPDRADPRHLRPAREEQGGPGAGRAGPAELHEAAPARLGWQPVPPGRWPGRQPGRRHRWPWSR